MQSKEYREQKAGKPGVLHAFSYLILITTIWSRYFYPHYIDEVIDKDEGAHMAESGFDMLDSKPVLFLLQF